MGNLAGTAANAITQFFEKLVPYISISVIFFSFSACGKSVVAPSVTSINGTPVRERGSVPVNIPAEQQGTSSVPALPGPVSVSADASTRFVGEIFGEKVPDNNYHFVRGVIAVFGNKFGAPPKTKEELDAAIWDELLMSLVAFSQNITVTAQEVDAEIAKTLTAEKVTFDRAQDPSAYQLWLRQKAGLTPELFENQIRHLLQLAKLKNHVVETVIAPRVTVSDEEAYFAFLSEHNTLSVELVQFETQHAADAFYKKVSGAPRAWDREKKRYAKDVRKPGFVSLEFLIDLWGFPADAAFAMMKRPVGDIYPPRPVYKGYAVFKIVEVRQADTSLYPKSKEGYIEKVKAKKKVALYNQWFAALKNAAQIKKYGEVPNNVR